VDLVEKQNEVSKTSSHVREAVLLVAVGRITVFGGWRVENPGQILRMLCSSGLCNSGEVFMLLYYYI